MIGIIFRGDYSEGSLYKLWITVRDISSSDRSYDLELAIFLLFEWNERISDIREQIFLYV